jgi:hypothetical protein
MLCVMSQLDLMRLGWATRIFLEVLYGFKIVVFSATWAFFPTMFFPKHLQAL